MTHARSLDLAPARASQFIGTYAELRGLSDSEVTRVHGLRLLNEVEWATVHVSGLTSTRLRRYLHARPGADPDAYAATQIAEYRRRIVRVRDLLG